MARKSDPRSFILDLNHLGIISISGPHQDGGEQIWTIEASDGATTWVLAEAPNYNEAISIQRRLFNSLATGEKAINLNAARRQSME